MRTARPRLQAALTVAYRNVQYSRRIEREEATAVWFVRSLVIMAGVIAVLWLGMENAGETVDFTFFTRHYPGLSLNFLMLLVFVSGMVFSFLISVVNEMNLRRQLAQAKRDVLRVNREVASLRSLPLDDTDLGSAEKR